LGVRGIDYRTQENLKRVFDLMKNQEENFKLAWIIINGIKTRYLISSNGMVYKVKDTGEIKIIKSHLTKDGHLRTGIKLDCEDKAIKKYVHVLVAEAFVPNPDNKPYIHHKDGDGINNDYKNLAWVTKEEHDILTKELNQYKGKRGSENPSSIYSDEQIETALKLMEENELYPDEICKIAGITYSVFQHLRFRDNSWDYIRNKYDISGYNKFRRREYSDELKIKFINLRTTRPDLRLRDISKILDVPYSNIKQWNRKYKNMIEERSTTIESIA